nr:hypothetical protein [Tanacetum cinerariifolium]
MEVARLDLTSSEFNLGSPISKDDIVNISLDGFPEKYEHVSRIIIHWEPFPDLKTVHSMLTTAEMRLKSWSQVPSIDSSSSSPIVLLANSGTSNAHRSIGGSGKINKPCFYFSKGFCWFGDNCRYMHSSTNTWVNGNTSLWSSSATCPSSSSSSTNHNMTPEQMMVIIQIQQSLLAQQGYSGNVTDGHNAMINNNNVGTIRNTTKGKYPSIRILGQLSGQETTLPHAFNAMTLQDPSTRNWNMDTCASSHLNDSVSNLSNVFNLCVYPSVSFIRNNSYTIEFEAFGFSVKDFLTRRVLLRCDSTGDLYPVTKSSLIPHDFLTESSNIISNIIHQSPWATSSPTSFPPSSPPTSSPTTSSPLSSPTNTTLPPQPQPYPSPVLVLPMGTHFCFVTNHPTQCLNFHVSSISPIPKSYTDVFNDPNWQNTMNDEYHAHIKNNSWTLVPRLAEANVVRCMRLFRHKYLAGGTLSRYKARLVANGSTQLSSVDVAGTFSPVVKPGTIQTVLSLVVSRHWLVHQLFGRFLNVKNAFLHDDITESVYMHQLPGFLDYAHPNYQIVTSLRQEFFMTDLGSLNYYLGQSVARDSSGMFLSQRKYATEILERAHMVGCNSSRTPVDTESKLGDDVQYVCLYMHDPREPHFSDPKRILRYVRGCPTTQRSTSGYCVFLDNNLLSWSSKRQPIISCSSAKAEYRRVVNAVA